MTSIDNTTFPIEAAEALAPYGADHVALFQYWQLLRDAAGGLPPWRSFDPIQVPQHLACLWVVEVHEAPRRLRYRLVGTRIVASFGHETTGKWFDEIWPHLAGQPDYTQRYTDAIAQVRPNFRRGKPRMIAQRDWARIENLFLPFQHPGLGGIIAAYSHLYDQDGRRIY
ncbi:PAS domain-containing protein [Ferrovibrio sp.]|uniref:PAS domain-containing protein n=1 Tax=Ferrovibrio sp. TaxID=1917215 RepID=UPI001B541B4B|nr:PAS domain-containing protein [Ferrovibrio sp.]MBP7063325.1 PAS domain-containing protein [Ferrovibrio sp.]